MSGRLDTREIIKRALAAGFDEAVVSAYRSKRSYLKIANSKIDSIVTKYGEYAHLFVTSKKRVFFTNIEKLEKKEVAEAVSRAKRAISMLKPKEDYNGIAEGPFGYNFKQTVDKKIAGYDSRLLSDIAESAINGALSGGANNVAGMLEIHSSDHSLATSKKVYATGDRDTFVRLSVRAFGNGLSAQRVAATKKLAELEPERFGRETAELAGRVNETGRIENGKYDVIYLQSPAGATLDITTDMATIGGVESGGFLTGKLGKQIANKNITIYDDGRYPPAIGSGPFDSEGSPTQRTRVVENGVLKTYLHNHSTAVKYKTKSTGNGGLVLPDPNTFILEHKKKVANLDRLIAQVDRGILVTNTWYMRFSNYLTGDFSTVPRDITIYIEKGEPRFAIRQGDVSSMVGIRISDNMIRMLKNIEIVADDTIQTSSWDSGGDYYFSPSILVREVDITTA